MTSRTEPDLGVLIALAYEQFVSELREHLAAAGFANLGRADGFVFRTLEHGPMTVSDLSALLGVTKQGAAQIVNDMQSRGLVRRGQDPRDARARPVELTERGRAAVQVASAFHRRAERDLEREHGADAVAVLRAVLTSVVGPAGSTDVPHFRMGVL